MPLVGGLHVLTQRAGLALPPTSAGRISMFSVAWIPDPLVAGNECRQPSRCTAPWTTVSPRRPGRRTGARKLRPW